MSNIDGIKVWTTPVAAPGPTGVVVPSPTASDRPTVAYIALTSASAMVAIGLFFYIAILGRNHHILSVIESRAAAIIEASGGSLPADVAPPGAAPSEKPLAPAVVSSYTVPAAEPRYLKIAKLHVASRVIKLSENSAGKLLAPRSIYDAGWYSGSSKPGEGGATLIDGHSTGPTKEGIFGKLDSLVAGDIISVVRGDGRVVDYQVVAKKHFPEKAVDMVSAISPVTPGKAGLNLITCGGTVNTRTNEFSERIIIYAQAL